MSEKKTGGPVFPIPLRDGEYYNGEGSVDGMTLRDYFAAKAMVYFLENINAHIDDDISPVFEELDTRGCNALKNAEIKKMSDFISLPKWRVYRLRNCGKITINKILDLQEKYSSDYQYNQKVSEKAYNIADAMLAEREK